MTNSHPPVNHDNWVVGIGASAGGLEALTQFVAQLPDDFHAPIIIAQHLAPRSKSMMVELLQRHSSRPVVSALDKGQIETHHIYVVPPNYDIDIQPGRITLNVAGSETRPKPSINEFFTSLAAAYGSRTVAVVLSGTGTDGSEGIRSIKAAGGLTLAQDDLSAKYDGMPNSAVHTGDIDAILPPGEIAKSLGALMLEHALRRQGLDDNDDQAVAQIFRILKEQSGTDFAKYKGSTIHRRLIRRMSLTGFRDYGRYLDKLRGSPAEVAQLAKDLLVSVTSFFRDADSFTALSELVTRIVRGKQDGEDIRVWCAGCATGEEAYTLAILFLEELHKHRSAARLKIFATDLDQDALLDARDGGYPAKEVENIPPALRSRYFHADGERYVVTERLRDVVVFARQDLTSNPPFVKIDLISCRNVLIYFNVELQQRILEGFHYALNPGGILLLGKSENANTTSPLFETLDRTHKIYGRLNVPAKPPTGFSARAPVAHMSARPLRGAGAPTIAELSYLRLIRDHGICGATVDEDCNIVHLIGDVSEFLGFFTPHADFRLTNLLPKGVGLEVPMLIRRASEDGHAHRSRIYRGYEGMKTSAFTLTVRPLNDDTAPATQGRRLFVVSFEAEDATAAVGTTPAPTPLESDEAAARIASLEHELMVTREHLQTVIEELGVTNEELQSLNEELSSTNEELQASSEELETTNEELQSSNEELTTVNEELTAKNAEVRELNLSFENVQNSIGIPMVLLDREQRVVRHNPEAHKLFPLTPADVGRPIARISSNFETEDFLERIRAAIENGNASESLVEVGASVYQMRILPCFDDDRAITGAILIFVDNTPLLRAQARIRMNEERLRAIVDGSSGPIFLKDNLGRYLLTNASFRELFGLNEDDITGRTDRELFDENLAVAFREADLEVFVSRGPKDTQQSLETPRGRKHFLFRRFPLFDEDSRTPYAVGAVATDITAQIETQERLGASENRYRAIVEDRFVLVARFREDGHLTYTNRSLVAQFGREFDTPSNRVFLDLVAPADRDRVRHEITAIRAQNPLGQFEHRVDRGDQPAAWLRWIMRGVFDEAGTLSEIQAVGFDVTELRQQTDQLIEKDGIYSRVFDYTQDFLSIYRIEDGDFYLEFFNRSAARTLGQGHQQMLGQNLRDLASGDRVEETLARYRRAAEGGLPELFEQEIPTPDGVRFFSTNIVPIPGLDGKVERIAAISRDVSRQKQTELDLRRAKEEADAANRAKSEFLASMSHELRTPLNVVLGMSQLLGDTGLSAEQRQFTNSIYRSGKVLLTLIEDVLDFSRIEAGKMSLDSISFSVAHVIGEVRELFETQARDKNLELITDIPVLAETTVIGDPARLRQVVVNLVSNAIKFTDRGSVTIRVRAEKVAAREEMRIHLEVHDTGIGIPEEAHRRLFQRFSQIDSGNSRRYGGSGLGLTISKNLVHLMGGQIGFESASGDGSRFYIDLSLPISHRQPEKARRSVTRIRDGEDETRPLRILAVDDSPDSRSVIGHFLERLGHEVTLAGGGHEALSRIEDGDFELVLMDIQMPDLDGFEATRRIRAMKDSKQRTPVIALTANALAGDAKLAFDAGMDDYITKPIQLQALKELLAKWEERL